MRILQILFCAFLVVLVADTAWSRDLSEEVMQKVAQKVVQALPQDVHVRSLAISEIEGDDGSLSRLLTQKIQEHSHYILVEREELEQIIDEQGFQVSDLVSPEQRVEPGQIKGVEGILFGEIVQKNGWPMQEELKVHLRLGNVQTGEILMAQDFSASSAAPYRNAVYAAVALGVLLLVMGFVLRSRARSRAQRREQANWDLRQDSTNELQLTQKNLQNAESSCQNLMPQDFLEEIRTLSFRVGRIRDKLQTAKWGADGTGSSSRVRRGGQRFQAGARALRELSDRIHGQAQSGDEKKMQELLLELKENTDNLESGIYRG